MAISPQSCVSEGLPRTNNFIKQVIHLHMESQAQSLTYPPSKHLDFCGEDVSGSSQPITEQASTSWIMQEHHLTTLLTQLDRSITHLAVVLAESLVQMCDNMDGQQVSQQCLPLQHHSPRMLPAAQSRQAA